jgi:hypothetical protein
MGSVAQKRIQAERFLKLFQYSGGCLFVAPVLRHQLHRHEGDNECK